jgi:ABC-2 type transport system permease protein
MSLKFNTLKEIYSLVVDELTKIFTDGGVMLLLFGATIIYPLLYSITYQPEVLTDAPIAIIDEDNSALSRNFIRMMDATPEVSIYSAAMDISDAQNMFYSGDVAGILLIPEDFSQSISKGIQAHVSVYADASYMMLYKQVYTATIMASQTLGKQIEVKKRMMKGTPREAAIKQSSPIGFSARGLYNPSGGYGSYAMPAILVLVLQQTLLLGIGMRGGTARELGAQHFLLPVKASRKGVLRIIIAKTLAYLLLYIPISFYVMPLILASILLGFLFTTLFKNRENSIIFLLFTSVPLVFLSGFSWPMESFPFGFRFLAYLFPSTPGIQGILKINVMGGTWHNALPEIATLWVMTVVLFLANWIIVRIKMVRDR